MAGKTKYKNDWQRENTDRVSLNVPKGYKVKIQAHAAARGESVNGFIARAIAKQIELDNAETEGQGTPETLD